MNDLIVPQKQRLMTSEEVASLCQTRHAQVAKTANHLRSINLIDYSTYDNGLLFDQRNSLVLVARLSPEFTAAVIDRWQELEKQQAPALPQTFSEALQLAADQAKQLEEQAPKVEFVDKYVASDTGNKGFRQVAKLLKVKENWFREYLVQNKIMYKLDGEWVPYQNHTDAGRFEVKAGTKNNHAYNTAKFTPKGVQWIAELIGK